MLVIIMMECDYQNDDEMWSSEWWIADIWKMKWGHLNDEM